MAGRILSLLCALQWFAACDAADTIEDILLQKTIIAYQIQPLTVESYSLGPKVLLGQALFFDPILSGPKGIACATCHIRSQGSGDGLPLAVGLGASGLGEERLSSRDAFIIPRNTLPLFNRGDDDFVAFFWDGRVQRGDQGRSESPLGHRLPYGFDSLLSVASVFPLVEPDEMLGHAGHKVSTEAQHNDLVDLPGIDNNYQARALNAFENVLHRLTRDLGRTKTEAVQKYHELFIDAYPDIPPSELSIAQVGNALAAYIRYAFQLQLAPWDQYVLGHSGALTLEQKRGAILFYGKGRCAVCHSGTQFSDFSFHGVAIPQTSIGKHAPYQDYGRAAASGRSEDRYVFRTPPLRNVLKTGPWGHNGVFSELAEIIRHHSNPVPMLYMMQQDDAEIGLYSGRLLSHRSSLFAEMAPLSITEVEYIVAFLSSLNSLTVVSDELALPKAVPSGSSQFISH